MKHVVNRYQWVTFTIISIVLICLFTPRVYAAGKESSYQQLNGDLPVSRGVVTVLGNTFTLATSQYVYLQSDGRIIPNGPAIAAMQITIDGTPVSNASVVDWSKSTNSQQHSYNVIGATYLAAGTHTAALTASAINSAFSVGASSNLTVMTSPATSIQTSTLGQDVSSLGFNTNGIKRGAALPHTPILSQTVIGLNQPVIALASGRIYLNRAPGDPLTTIYLDGQEPSNDKANWSDNDTYSGAENQSPFFNHAFYNNLPSGNHSITWEASALAYCEDNSCSGLANTVNFNVGALSELITLNGGLIVFGSAAIAADPNNRTNYIGVASNLGLPAPNTDVTIAETTISIPASHNGVVLFTGKTRVQGDQSDLGGTALLWLTIDGNSVGSTGVQQIKYPNSVSTRTISTSYLATGAQALTPGSHKVALHGKGIGSFRTLSYTKDLPLIWFD